MQKKDGETFQEIDMGRRSRWQLLVDISCTGRRQQGRQVPGALTPGGQLNLQILPILPILGYPKKYTIGRRV